MRSLHALLIIAIGSVAACSIGNNPACAQIADFEALNRRVADLEWRAQQSDALSAEVERLRFQLAAVNAQLRQDQQPQIQVVGYQLGSGPVASQSQIVVPSGGAASFQPEPEPIPAPAAAVPAANGHSGYGGGYGGYGYGDGLQIGFWGWLSYLASPQQHYASFWAWEAQLDVTKTFTERIAASADVSFTDTNNGAYVTLDQCFISFLIPEFQESIVTAGKYYAPFGIEPHDFWYRITAEPTLLFYAIPQELTGLMDTQPLADDQLIVRPFVVNGFNDNFDINQQPSLGMAVEYRPCECLSVEWTNWWGPEFHNDNDDKLFFTLAQSTWHITPKLCLASEFLYGETESRGGRLDWAGYALIVSQTLTERWRIYGQWSELDDGDGYFAGTPKHGRQIGCGLSYFFDPHVEWRTGWAHNMTHFNSPAHTNIADMISTHLTFGY